MHTPVLLNETLEGLSLKEGDSVIDGTLGLGGHSKAIIERILPGGFLFGIDQDERNIVHAKENLKKFEKSIKIVHGNFANAKELIEKNSEIKSFDAILLDIGMASTHIDEEERGFSFCSDGPLDMRMNIKQELTAEIIVNTYSEKELADIIYRYGEERHSWRIAKMIIEKRKMKKFKTTRELATAIEEIVRNKNKHPALLTFQALRISVNNELESLAKGLRNMWELLSYGGYLAVISYHSLEDRIVKQFFRAQARDCICPKEFPVCKCNFKPQLKLITKRPIVPSEEEIKNNPRSRSAKLRVAQRTNNEFIDFLEEAERIKNLI